MRLKYEPSSEPLHISAKYTHSHTPQAARMAASAHAAAEHTHTHTLTLTLSRSHTLTLLLSLSLSLSLSHAISHTHSLTLSRRHQWRRLPGRGCRGGRAVSLPQEQREAPGAPAVLKSGRWSTLDKLTINNFRHEGYLCLQRRLLSRCRANWNKSAK